MLIGIENKRNKKRPDSFEPDLFAYPCHSNQQELVLYPILFRPPIECWRGLQRIARASEAGPRSPGRPPQNQWRQTQPPRVRPALDRWHPPVQTWNGLWRGPVNPVFD